MHANISKKSDLDLLAIQETELSFFEQLDGILKVIQLIVPYWGVDLLIYTPDELEKFNIDHLSKIFCSTYYRYPNWNDKFILYTLREK